MRYAETSMFAPLAVYQAECERGILHSKEWRKRMARLGADFARWQLQQLTHPDQPVIHVETYESERHR